MAGDLFLAFSNLVYKVTPDGTQTAVGSGFSQPTGVAVDVAGDVFVADTGKGRVTKVASNGTQTTVGSGFSQPAGVTVDVAGDVFVADTGSNRVVKVQLTPNFGNVNIGSSATQTLSYNIDANTTLGTPIVLTDGAPNLDFTLDLAAPAAAAWRQVRPVASM